MVLRYLRPLAVAALLIVGGGLAVSSALALEPVIRRSPQYDLFYNKYTNGPATQAKMYTAPMPVPEWVGHTYVTYQPLIDRKSTRLNSSHRT